MDQRILAKVHSDGSVTLAMDAGLVEELFGDDWEGVLDVIETAILAGRERFEAEEAERQEIERLTAQDEPIKGEVVG